MAIYICAKCLFCFERISEVKNCPDCGNINVRDATEEEVAEYVRYQKEFSGGYDPERK